MSNGDNILTRAQRLVELSEKLPDQKWKAIRGDDDVSMSMCLVATDDAPEEMAYCSRDPKDEYDQTKVVAATLVQSPGYVDGPDSEWWERANFIAASRNDGPAIAQALVEAVEVIKGMVIRADAMNENADAHPDKDHIVHKSIGGDRVAHAGRDFLAKLGGDADE